MSVRKRSWGECKSAWIVDFSDVSGRRRIKTFALRKDAEKFHGLVRAVGHGQIPDPLTNERPIDFTVDLPDKGIRNGVGREELVAALRAACPLTEPTADSVIIHITAEISPRAVIADVDNLLKPVLDALKGVAWLDDTQVCELVVRRHIARQRRLHIKIWRIPGLVVNTCLNALAERGHPATARRWRVSDSI